MTRNLKLLSICLWIFDGDGGSGSGGEGAAATGEATQAGALEGQTQITGNETQGEIQSILGRTRRGKKTGGNNVLFGKQDATAQENATEQKQNPADAGQETQVNAQDNEKSIEEKRKSFRDIINGEYKDIYTEETQRIIDRRFRETKQLEEITAQQQPVIELMMQRYNIEDGDMNKLMSAIENDNLYWNEAAEEAGMDVDQYKQLSKLQRENESFKMELERQRTRQAAQQQLQAWYTDGERVKQIYPEFDLSVEAQNPQFLSMLKTGVPVQHAYEVLHIDDIKAGIAKGTAQETAQQVVANIRAKGQRPAENGTSSQSAFTVKDDPSKWSKADRLEVARRVARGEKIAL